MKRRTLLVSAVAALSSCGAGDPVREASATPPATVVVDSQLESDVTRIWAADPIARRETLRQTKGASGVHEKTDSVN